MKYSTLIYDMTSEEYHSTPNSVSSSKLKDLLTDPKVYYEKHVEKSVDKEQSSALDVGSYFHTAILEPHNLKEEFAIFNGVMRKGKDYERLKKKNPKKIIITSQQKKQADRIIDAVKRCKKSMSYIKRGKAEVSLFIKLVVKDKKIYAKKEKLVLTKFGWKKVSKVPAGTEIVAKVRADTLATEHFFISDLKSTSSADAFDKNEVKASVEYYNYGLSAAFYVDMFNVIGLGIKNFYWIFASKKKYNAKTWKASKKNILEGRANWAKAIITLAECMEADWKFKKVEEIGPSANYNEIINEVWG